MIKQANTKDAKESLVCTMLALLSLHFWIENYTSIDQMQTSRVINELSKLEVVANKSS